MSLLEQDNIRKGRVEIAIELDKGNSEEYEVEAICDSAVYARESEGYLPGLYYLADGKATSRKKTPGSLLQQ